MPFEIPADLHPDLTALAWMIGRWEGTGRASYPGIEDFEFGQQIDFAHNGENYLHYLSQTFELDADGKAIKPFSMETGFWRPQPDGSLEVVLCHPGATPRSGTARSPAPRSNSPPTRSCGPPPPRSTPPASGSTATSRATCCGRSTRPRRSSAAEPPVGPPPARRCSRGTPPRSVDCPRHSASLCSPRRSRRGVPWHFGDPMREQRGSRPDGAVDLSHRGVLTVTGPDRLTWLHSLTTQHLDRAAPGVGMTTLVLSPQGHLEHALYGVDDGNTFWAHTEPGAAAAAVAWLDRMRFMMRVEVADRTPEYAVVWRAGPPDGDRLARSGLDSLGGHEIFVPRAELAGTWPSGRGRHLGVRGPPDRGRRAPDRHRHRPPHHPQRARPARRRRSIWTRAATAARRRSPGCTPSVGRRGGSCGCTWTAPRRAAAGRRPLELDGRPSASSAARRGTSSSARSRWVWSSATSTERTARLARRRRRGHRRGPGNPGRPRDRPARPRRL